MDGSAGSHASPTSSCRCACCRSCSAGLMLEKLLAAHEAGQLQFFGAHRAARRRQGVRRLPRAAQEEALVRLRQAPLRRSEGGARLSVALHPSRRHLEPRLIAADEQRASPSRSRTTGSGPRPLQDDDARRDEFIRRFLLHVLPKGFHRIRHYGLFASGEARRHDRAGARAPRSRPRPKAEGKRSRPIQRRRRCSPTRAPAAAAACSSSRPSRPAASHATGRPRLSSQSGSIPHERRRRIPRQCCRPCSSLVTDQPRRARPDRCPAVLSARQRHLERRRHGCSSQADRPSSAAQLPTAAPSLPAPNPITAVKSP